MQIDRALLSQQTTQKPNSKHLLYKLIIIFHEFLRDVKDQQSFCCKIFLFDFNVIVNYDNDNIIILHFASTSAYHEIGGEAIEAITVQKIVSLFSFLSQHLGYGSLMICWLEFAWMIAPMQTNITTIRCVTL